ncbi:Predicted arabinose efflux permease, MFS family [Cryobacterium psychrotolerans]|uniref:Predicted arabinose efflux permease, MFS family n=1 Tax=Cryobacterium psychrotolerans TaxID=386301 RepID=A0A1G9HDX9_9MICO|nr:MULTISPECIES: MFS transporter [Cryobacterium]TFD42576.1 MFS transporter [Cryobacterium sp. TMT1-2-1]TFD83256.1 MFS transporter [Cryobacterium psychrotolerans]SDL11231.1 Predicted arabinose efflux permease, MFS family [Cryobacterium psychrotolerans]
MSNAERPFSLRSVALAAFLPTLLFSIGEGAIIPLIPIVANNLGASLAVAGFIAAMVMVGELVGDIPAGWVVSRIGERNSMIWASMLTIIAVLICVAAPNPLVLGVGIFLVGIATAVFALARHAFMTSYVPIAYRARALSTLGGIFRAGWFIGPFISAGLIHLTGSTVAVFWVFIVCCLAAAGMLLLLPDPVSTFGPPEAAVAADGSVHTAGEELAAQESTGLFRTIWNNRGVLARLGTGAGLVGGMRASRTVILPLWAVSIGISEPDIALIIGIAGGIDFALFYVSGQVMDRFGRIWTALPSMIGLGVGHIMLAFTHDLPSNVEWFIGVAMFLSLANGIGSGILMTLGADLAPKARPAPFLGAWRFTGDFGSAAAPLAVAGLTAVASLSLASAVMGVFGLFGAVLLGRYIPRYLPRRGRPSA